MKAVELLEYLQNNLDKEDLNSYYICGECTYDNIAGDIIGIHKSDSTKTIYLKHF